MVESVTGQPGAGGEVVAHPPDTDHPAADRGGIPEVPGDPHGIVLFEEHPLTRQAGQRHLDVDLELGLPLHEAVLEGDVGDEAAHIAAPFDGGYIDVGMVLEQVRGDRVGWLRGWRPRIPPGPHTRSPLPGPFP